MYTVKQTSEITGISGYTLRFYDKEGLFPHLNRDGQNRRLFSDEDLHNIETIQELREMGFSLAQIRSYLTAEEDGGMKRRRELLAEQMDRIRSELAAITRRMKKLHWRWSLESRRFPNSLFPTWRFDCREENINLIRSNARVEQLRYLQ